MDDENGHFYAVLDKENVCYVQAHIYTETNADWYAKLNFRDILRKDSKLAKEYNDYKLSLAKNVSDKSEYAALKTKWVDTFILKVFDACCDDTSSVQSPAFRRLSANEEVF